MVYFTVLLDDPDEGYKPKRIGPEIKSLGIFQVSLDFFSISNCLRVSLVNILCISVFFFLVTNSPGSLY